MTLTDSTVQSHASPLLREAVYEPLRADILSCRLPPGAEIREAELAARFAVSKSPVRDALMRLEREGLVITLPRQGYRVAPISIVDVQDMFHLRAALERACMERIVRQATDQQLAQLDSFRHFEPAQWEGGFIAYNRAFHRALSGLTMNVRMRDYLNELVDQMERVVLVSLSNVKKGDPQSLVNEHCQIIDALQARKLKLAERSAQKHIVAAGKRVTSALSKIVIAV